jgi:hypothetical protein
LIDGFGGEIKSGEQIGVSVDVGNWELVLVIG